MIKFFDPWWLLAFVVLPGIYYIYKRSTGKKKRAVIKFSSTAMVKIRRGKGRLGQANPGIVLFVLNILIISMLILALADPRLPLKRSEKGVNVVLAIDVSGSMLAKDYPPSRIEAAKEAARILIDDLRPEDYVGIVTFSNGATTVSYLTPDRDRVLEKLETVTAREASTALGDGLSIAVDMASSIPNRKKVVVLLSDGVSNAGVISPDEAIEFARTNDLQVYTVGMGSDRQVLLGYDLFGRPQYASLDEETLKKIAVKTDGEYFRSVDRATLEKIYSTISQKIEREKVLTPVGNWFVILALLLMFVKQYLKYERFVVIP